MTRERTQRAVALQDLGKLAEARELLLQNATELHNLMAAIPVTQRMIDLRTQYLALGAPAPGPAKPDQLNAGRKLLRQLDAPAANAAVRY